MTQTEELALLRRNAEATERLTGLLVAGAVYHELAKPAPALPPVPERRETVEDLAAHVAFRWKLKKQRLARERYLRQHPDLAEKLELEAAAELAERAKNDEAEAAEIARLDRSYRAQVQLERQAELTRREDWLNRSAFVGYLVALLVGLLNGHFTHSFWTGLFTTFFFTVCVAAKMERQTKQWELQDRLS